MFKHNMTIEQYAATTDLLRSGKKVNAIKHVRQCTGLGLKESKGIVDNWNTPTKK